ncbi:response regulator transcription factor [Streptomyces sp. NPDC101194]|uniref:response regulator transcription factor n=1 Tax=Streptomyces sp. NPDC101194 TaxID=3366127 RepID=UPI00381B44A0
MPGRVPGAASGWRRGRHRYRRGSTGQGRRSDVDGLTEREREAPAPVGRSRSNTEIAEDLFITVATATSHVSRLFTTPGARDRVRLVITAYEMGLATLPR